MVGPDKFVGWVDQSEWNDVFFNVFSGDEERIKRGLTIINIWRCRFAGAIPVAIEATSQILECMITRVENKNMKKLSMATAVSQFLGLLTERALKNQIHTMPMRIRSEEVGIPQWIATLRHEIAHGLIPSYELLDKGIQFGLKWLRVNHWEEHARHFCERQKIDIQRQLDSKESQIDDVKYADNIPDPTAVLSVSWELFEQDVSDCILGVMPGQTREKLWQELHGPATFDSTERQSPHSTYPIMETTRTQSNPQFRCFEIPLL